MGSQGDEESRQHAASSPGKREHAPLLLQPAATADPKSERGGSHSVDRRSYSRPRIILQSRSHQEESARGGGSGSSNGHPHQEGHAQLSKNEAAQSRRDDLLRPSVSLQGSASRAPALRRGGGSGAMSASDRGSSSRVDASYGNACSPTGSTRRSRSPVQRRRSVAGGSPHRGSNRPFGAPVIGKKKGPAESNPNSGGSDWDQSRGHAAREAPWRLNRTTRLPPAEAGSKGKGSHRQGQLLKPKGKTAIMKFKWAAKKH